MKLFNDFSSLIFQQMAGDENFWKLFWEISCFSPSISLFTHLKEFSHSIIVKQILLSVRLITTVVHVLIEVPLQAKKRLANHARIVSIEFDTFNQDTKGQIR